MDFADHVPQGARFTPHHVPPDIVMVEWQPCVALTDGDAEHIMGFMRSAGTAPRPLLVHPQDMRSISRNALAAFAETGWVSRMAVTGRSLIDGFLLEIYDELYRPPYEVRHFEVDAAALAWLRSPDTPIGPVSRRRRISGRSADRFPTTGR